MFGIGMTELMVILVIGLVVIGPKKLPGLARSLGKSLAEFRRASDDMRREFLDVAQSARIDPADADEPDVDESPAVERPRPPETDEPPDAAAAEPDVTPKAVDGG
jgi:Tat protein translocase TatB subunit